MIDPGTTRDLALRLSRATNQQDAFSGFEEISRDLFRHILFTVLRFDYEDSVMTRLYSNREEVSPIGGSKPIPTTGLWAHRIITERKFYVGYTKEDLKEVFFDYEALWAIGCGSVMNVPVVWHDKTIGSFNVLGRECQYDDWQALSLDVLSQLAVPLFLNQLRREPSQEALAMVDGT